MFSIFKKKQKNIEILRLEYDMLSKVLLFINALFILFLGLYHETAIKPMDTWKAIDWVSYTLVLIVLLADGWVIKRWFGKFDELSKELEK